MNTLSLVLPFLRPTERFLQSNSFFVAASSTHLQKAAPNPSLERTHKGWPRYALCPFSAPRGQPFRPAQLKR
jgi:hypothetical protein